MYIFFFLKILIIKLLKVSERCLNYSPGTQRQEWGSVLCVWCHAVWQCWRVLGSSVETLQRDRENGWMYLWLHGWHGNYILAPLGGVTSISMGTSTVHDTNCSHCPCWQRENVACLNVKAYFLQFYTFLSWGAEKMLHFKAHFLQFYTLCHVLCVFMWYLSDSNVIKKSMG